ncbi:hypothetical protein [Commensalibacter communis]|uniref:hypothetical protein n=1 Tax=Commensalibacter communis TaxID=2972786 RepID=UPI0022FFB9E5|nr:hypothetical protein [Commensalibacter communis]CAI3960455.1 Ca2+-binding protein [Commensalibacter communis]CAI3960489.1 Ca2+-binding protein [Commensalibacter communis]
MTTFKMSGSNTEIELGSGEAQRQLNLTQSYLQQKIPFNRDVWDEYSNPYKEHEFQIARVYGSGSTQYINHFNTDVIMVGDNVQDTNPNKAFTLKYKYIGNYSYYNTIVSGRKAGINITANGTSGKIINTVGKLYFNGSGYTSYDDIPMGGIAGALQIGNWEIYNGDDDSNINLTYGQNTIVAGNGNNKIYVPDENQTGNEYNIYSTHNGINNITLGNGSNTIYVASGINFVKVGQGNNNITIHASGLNRANSDVMQHTIITGDGSNNISVYGHSSQMLLGNGDNKVSLTTGMLSRNPINNVIDSGTGHLDISAAIGNVTISAAGATNIKGGDAAYDNMNFGSIDPYLNLTLNASGDDNVFHAGKGNTTLNAAHSNKAIDVSAANDKTSTLVAVTGRGDDTLTAGSGQSTFSGGLGDNLFAFTKENTNGGSTVIKDFSASSGNQIALFNYGLNRTSLKQLLNASQNDAQGNAILNLNTNTITLQGVSVSELNTNQFFVYNNK